MRLDTDRWMDGLSRGSLRVTPQLPGYTKLGADWGFRDRRLGAHVLYGVVRGRILVSCAGTNMQLAAGSVFWLMPDVPHTFSLATHEPQPTMLYHMRMTATDQRSRACALDRPWVYARHAGGVLPYFDQLFAELDRIDRYASYRVRGRLAIFFSALLVAASSPSSAKGLTERQRTTLRAYLEERIHRRPTPTDLADAINLSEEYFAKLFKLTYGQSPRSWLVQERIRHASIALSESRASVGDIARKYGYDDLYLFSRQFRQVMGCSPRDFRRQHG